ncbi:TfoX/Sxy family protein [Acanthopleuribacter pedis]|uniref:TfoX/Sxy family protein n=1 Tax=Acanthopleuribacter pedis TaxID=442870 RepID=A0A8J7U1U6_9BACT|nr:TfoX/Sxy family protein [Acanthopleuribacter pedis]MBO1317266.1 TfoX/Sxy family protein [Acanthopleuribacter pedis]MBO1318573.1 TfoX/Sxy family protein [Acanthopleuribacter pedis]
MAYDADLAVRIEAVLHGREAFSQRKMFGGVAYMLNGNMCVGIHKDWLVVRLAPETAASLLDQPGVKPFDITGRPMKGWLLVAREAMGEAAQLSAWIERAETFVAGLPPKKPKAK